MPSADLIRTFLPHAPQHGLFVAPDLPRGKVEAACRDYAPDVAAADVVALYDNTLLGSAKDGAVFLPDRLVFQNNDLAPAQTVRYDDVVGARARKSLLGGAAVEVEVNRGRATVTERVDCSAHREAAPYIARFLHEAVVRSAARADLRAAPEAAVPTGADEAAGSDVAAVERALARLVADGLLADEDRRRMLAALRAR